jgi:2-polyprenyl-3-methyl-5-hydroxy-6-metoxy-1,4-benzoquinol methylase
MRYDDSYLEYETARHMEYREIALRSLSEAGLEPCDQEKVDDPVRSILEIGCATGALLSTFASMSWRAVGIEIGPSMAAYARSVFGLDVRTGTLESVALDACSFDVVIATHLIEHLNDPRSFLKEVHRVLRSDGQLFLITPNVDGFQGRLLGAGWRSAIRDHLYLFSVHTLKKMLHNEGFAVEYIGTWGGWPAGMKPSIIKKPMDRIAKKFGLGDVMIVRCRLSGSHSEETS